MKSAWTRGFLVVTVTAMTVMALWVPVGWAQQAPIQTGLVTGSGLPNYIPVWATNKSLGNSVVYQSSSQNVGVGTQTPGSKLDVVGDINFSGSVRFQGSPVLRVPTGLSIALGEGAMGNSTVGWDVAVGAFTLAGDTGGDNTAVGVYALGANTTGGANTAIGGGTIGFAGALGLNTTGMFNTASGFAALQSNTTGNNNVAVGAYAGINLSGNTSNNIHISNRGFANDNGTIRIGTLGTQSSFFTAGVAGATVSGAQVLVDTTTGQLGVASSSRRFKEDIQDMGDTSGGLMRLRPVTFRYEKPFADGNKPIQYGLIAEEVAEVYPELVAHSADGQIETVKY